MKIVIAPDSFKENMTSLEVATAIEKGILEVMSDMVCSKLHLQYEGERLARLILVGQRIERRLGKK